MPVTTWFILRLVVPVMPVLIQYLLGYLGVFTPTFPQPTYLLLLFTLAAVTISEYEEFGKIIALSVVPLLLGTVLYMVHLLVPNNPVAQQQALLLGFYAWLVLGVIHSIRVLCEWFVRRKRTS